MTGRRLLVATAVANYSRAPQWDRLGLVAAREEIIRLFTETFGYRHLSDLGLNPTANQLVSQLRTVCKKVDPDDHLVVYIAGHGETLEATGDHVLLTADTDPDDIEDALPTAGLARKMLLGTPVQRLMLLLDTCYSGRGGDEVAAEALTRITRTWDTSTSSGFVVVTSTQPAEQAEAGAFPKLLGEAIDNLATVGHAPPTVSIAAVVTAMNNSPARPGYQQIGWSSVKMTGELPDFLPNPRHRGSESDLDLYLQQVTEWERQAERREVEYRRRFLIRAMGGHREKPGWWFTGRHRVLTEIAEWLNHPDPARPGLVVTGGPGSGKTAVLGLVSSLADAERRRSVPLDALDLPVTAVPPVGGLDVTIYAGALNTDQVLAGLAAAAHLQVDSVGDLVAGLVDRTTPFTALIDALDEATDPRHLVTRLLTPLLEHGDEKIRLLLGSRPHLIPLLGRTVAKPIGLDDDWYADDLALTAYALRGLLEATMNSPYLDCPPPLTQQVAEAVAAAAAPSFLVARIVSSTLAAELQPANPSDPTWRATLPRLPGDAMRVDLERRLGVDAERARDLLRPLAFAEGQGLPWEDIWAPLASRISGHVYTDEDIIWLRSTAGSYVVEASEAGRSAYRLYHQALTEYLRSGSDAGSIDAAFLEVLINRVPRTAGAGRDWKHAHPYTLRYLAAHAERGRQIDRLIGDTDYLVEAAPDLLAPAIRTAITEHGQLMRTIYLASEGHHRKRDRHARRQLLAIDAARCGANAERDAFAAQLPWRPQWASGAIISQALRATLVVHGESLNAVACTELDGVPIAVTGSSDTTVRVWDLRTSAALNTLTGHYGGVRAVTCTELDGVPIAVTGSDDTTVRVWDLRTGATLNTLTGHDESVQAVACTELDGVPIAVTGSSDTTVRVWDLRTGATLNTLTGHYGGVRAVTCTELDGVPIAVTGSSDTTVRVWDLRTGATLNTLTGHDHIVAAVACTELDGVPIAVTGSSDTTVRVWDLRTGATLNTLTDHRDMVWAVACTELDGVPIAVTGSEDETVRVWDLRAGASLATYNGHDSAVTTLVCTELDGVPVAVTGSDDETARVWDLRFDPPTLNTLASHYDWVWAVACTELDGVPIAVTGSSDTTVRVWDLRSGATLNTLTGHSGIVAAVACTELDGVPIAVTGSDDTVRVWDLRTGATLNTLTGHYGGVRAVTCTELDGVPIAVTGSDDTTVRVWDLRSGATLNTFAGHDESVQAVACTELDGVPIAVTGSSDETVRVWDLRTGAALNTLLGHQDVVTSVTCTGLDGIAVTGSDDETVRVWALHTGAELMSYATPGPVGALANAGQTVVIGCGREVIYFQPWTNALREPGARS